MFIDAHTHLTDKAFDFDRKEVIERSGCVALVNNGYTISDNRATLVLAKEFPPVKVALGLHPSETAVLSQKEVDTEIEWIAKQKCVAIGEIGLDFTYDEPEKQIVSSCPISHCHFLYLVPISHCHFLYLVPISHCQFLYLVPISHCQFLYLDRL